MAAKSRRKLQELDLDRHMIQRPPNDLTKSAPHSFVESMQLLGETYTVRHVMVPLPRIEYVAPGGEVKAREIVAEKKYSVVPASKDGESFDAVFNTESSPDGGRTVTTLEPTSVSDYIPDSTPLAEAFFLFESREWYLTLRGNRVSGLITYWAFNSREFRVQLYAGISRSEELSRNVLATDGCGVSSREGLDLASDVLDKAQTQFDSSRKKLGGNRCVDELQFHHVHDALRKHLRWRDFLHERLGRELSNKEYGRLYDFTKLRDGVMHGRVLIPSYRDFQSFSGMVDNIGKLIGHLDAYSVPDTA